MGLEGLGGEIRADFKKRRDEETGRAEVEGAEELAKARREGETILSMAKADADRESQAVLRRDLASARLDARRMLCLARDGVVDLALAEAWNALAGYAKTEEYANLLKSRVDEAVESVGSDAVVSARGQDRRLLRGYRLREEDLESAGGTKVSAKDGSVTVDATFEAAFKEKAPKLRAHAYRRMFG